MTRGRPEDRPRIRGGSDAASTSGDEPAGAAALRFDVALFELRLFKSRAQAQQAIADGDALLNGERVKPSRDARPGDRVTLVYGDSRRTFEILALPKRPVSREAARALLRDVPA